MVIGRAYCTITRTTIIVCALQVLLYFLITPGPHASSQHMLWSLTSFFSSSCCPRLAFFVLATATFQQPAAILTCSIGAVVSRHSLTNPGGWVGSSDQVARVFAATPITADNMFLGYGVDLGALGLVAYLAVVFTIGLFSWRLFRNASTPDTRLVAATVFLTNIGIALNGASSSPFNSVFLAYNFFLLAGAAVSAYQRRGSTAISAGTA